MRTWGRGIAATVAMVLAGCIAGTVGVTGQEGPPIGPLLSFQELAALGPVEEDLWVAGGAPEGSAVHRYDGATGAHRGYATVPVFDGCDVGRLVPPTESGLWLTGHGRFGPPTDSAPAEPADFCLAFVPFDGGEPVVSRVRMKATETFRIDDAFATPGALVFAGGLVPRAGSYDPSKAIAIRSLEPGGTPTRLLKGGQGVAPGGEGVAFGIALGRSGWSVVRLDLASGRARSVPVGGRGFIPFVIAAGDGLVAVGGQDDGRSRTYVLDAISGEISGALATRGTRSPADGSVIVGGTLLVTTASADIPDTLQAAPVRKRMALQEVDRCACVYVSLGTVPGGAWFARLGVAAGGASSMVRWDGATGSLGDPVLIDPFLPFGRGAAMAADPLPPPPADARFESASIAPGSDIADRFTCRGQDVSPELAWSGAESEVAEYAILVTDPDAGDFVHWMVTDIPAGTTSLPEGAGGSGAPGPWRQGVNHFGTAGWAGPCPPARHEYVFTLYRSPVPVTSDPDDARALHEAFRAAGGTAQSFSAFFGS